MASVEQPSPEIACVNCGAALSGRYCAQCGEKRLKPGDFAFAHLLKETFEGIVHADSRFLRSCQYLLTRPGFLTAEYLRGRRMPYMKPLAFFLIINLFYFLTIGFNRIRTFETPLQIQYMNPYGSMATKLVEARLSGASADDRAAFEADFDHQNHLLSKSLLLVLAPLLALPLWGLFRRRRPYFAEHFITALHFLSLQLVLNMLIGILLRGGLVGAVFGYNPQTHVFIEIIEPILWFGIFAYFSLKTAYGESAGPTIWKTMVFTSLWFPILFLYRFLVFLATLYTL